MSEPSRIVFGVNEWSLWLIFPQHVPKFIGVFVHYKNKNMNLNKVLFFVTFYTFVCVSLTSPKI